MRILYLADIRFPLERANGVQTMETVWHLADRGHDVTLLVRPDTAPQARDPLAFYGVAARSRLTIARARVFGPSVLRRMQYLARAVTTASGRGRFDVTLTRDLGVASAILRMPVSARPPLIYESHGYAPDVRRQLPDLIPNARAASSTKLDRLARREAHVWRLADGYITITRALADDLTAMLGPRSRLAVVPDGAHLDVGTDRAWAGATHRPMITYAGHLYAWKGVDTLIAAARLLPEVRVRIVGGMPGEPDEARLRRSVNAAGLGDRVEFVGFVRPPEVRGWLTRSDVLVLPNVTTSVSARYTSPLKLFEYLAAGRPIVASRLPALEEILVDGRNAILVTPGDANALADGIARVIADPALAQRLAAQGIVDVADYTWSRRAERIEALLAAVATTS